MIGCEILECYFKVGGEREGGGGEGEGEEEVVQFEGLNYFVAENFA